MNNSSINFLKAVTCLYCRIHASMQIINDCSMCWKIFKVVWIAVQVHWSVLYTWHLISFAWTCSLTVKLIECRIDKWGSHANDSILSYYMGYVSCKSFLTTREKCAGVEFCMNKLLFGVLQITLLPQESSLIIVIV